MFENIDKKKALIYGGGFALLIVVFLVLRNGGGGSSATTTTVAGPTDAQLSASTQITLAQLSGAQSAAQTNAQLAAATQQMQLQLAEKQIDAQVATLSITADANNQAQQIAAQDGQSRYLADLQASVAKWTLDASVAQQANNNAFQLDYAKSANQSAEALATIQAGVLNNQILAGRDTTIATLNASAAQTASLLNAQVALGQSSDQRDIAIADINAGVQKKQSSNNLIGGIVGGLLGIFSDANVKEDITLIARETDGLGIYSYRYKGSKSWQVGVMAQEVRKLRPNAIGPKVAGWLTVNYGALAAA